MTMLYLHRMARKYASLSGADPYSRFRIDRGAGKGQIPFFEISKIVSL
jgi:hypothetical protein